MVPGLTERERRSADVQRLDWLAEAMVGPMRVKCEPNRPTPVGKIQTVLPIGLWRRGLAVARINGRRLHLMQPGATVPALAPAD